MRVAFFSDLHGNLPALDAVLADIERQRIDRIVCGGDFINPLWTSAEAYARLRARPDIAFVRGNHEDYAWRVHFDPAAEDMRASPRWQPVRLSAERLGPALAQELRALPFDLTIEGTEGDERTRAYFCHASPTHNARTPINGIDAAMAHDYDATQAALVVGGHWHLPWSTARLLPDGRPQLLVCAGSAGLPMRGSNQAEYAILTYRNGGGADELRGWTAEPRTIPYDREATLREFRESGALDAGGPIAWMLYDELASAQKRLGLFFPQLRERGLEPQTLAEWEDAARAFLREAGRWDFIRASLQDGGGR